MPRVGTARVRILGMADITVRALTEEEWDHYRSVRLAALQESPQAFVASYDEEADYDEDFWRLRMRRSQRLLAEIDGEAVGTASVGEVDTDDGCHAELFGLWVSPALRGKGIATKLVSAGARSARENGNSHLYYWVGTDNGRAVAFASGFGFRPTDQRRPVRVESEEDGPEEIAMVLSLAE
jgi:ribosomal protein S18 acetylase RimI-like enzyme